MWLYGRQKSFLFFVIEYVLNINSAETLCQLVVLGRFESILVSDPCLR